jgi:vesicle coat complex subunit
VELIENKVTYVVQEAIVVIKDIFRRFPDQYEKIIPILCENLDLLDEPEAKAAIIWIVGQYAERIENAEDLMENLTYSFLEESTEVRPILLVFSLTDSLPTGSTSSRHSLSQVLYPTAQPRSEARAKGAQVGNRRHRQPRLAGPRVHVLAPSRNECGCCEGHRHGRATARQYRHRPDGTRRSRPAPAAHWHAWVDLPQDARIVHSACEGQGTHRQSGSQWSFEKSTQ